MKQERGNWRDIPIEIERLINSYIDPQVERKEEIEI